MNARKIFVVVLASALAAVAQSAPPSQRVSPQQPPSHPAASPMKAKAKRQAPAIAKKKPAAAKSTATAKVKPAAEKATHVAANEVKAAGKRDPFLSPVREAGGPIGPNCSVGKKCIAIDSVVLKGIVESQVGAIAVVENPARRMTYFLRENDPVFNGFVVKITPDSITFRENVMDRLGKESTRDVVKKVNAPAV